MEQFVSNPTLGREKGKRPELREKTQILSKKLLEELDNPSQEFIKELKELKSKESELRQLHEILVRAGLTNLPELIEVIIGLPQNDDEIRTSLTQLKGRIDQEKLNRELENLYELLKKEYEEESTSARRLTRRRFIILTLITGLGFLMTRLYKTIFPNTLTETPTPTPTPTPTETPTPTPTPTETPTPTPEPTPTPTPKAESLKDIPIERFDPKNPTYDPEVLRIAENMFEDERYIIGPTKSHLKETLREYLGEEYQDLINKGVDQLFEIFSKIKVRHDFYAQGVIWAIDKMTPEETDISLSEVPPELRELALLLLNKVRNERTSDENNKTLKDLARYYTTLFPDEGVVSEDIIGWLYLTAFNEFHARAQGTKSYSAGFDLDIDFRLTVGSDRIRVSIILRGSYLK